MTLEWLDSYTNNNCLVVGSLNCSLSFVVDDVIVVYTNSTNRQDHVVMTTEQPFFAFKVDACTGFQVLLMTVPGVVDNHAYLISIGTDNNEKSSIQSLPPDAMFHDFYSANILPCTGLSSFWLSWTNNTIRFGVGEIVGLEQRFEQLYPAMYSINSFSLMSGDTKTVKWNFLRDYGGFRTILVSHYLS